MPYHTAILNDAAKAHAALSVFFSHEVRTIYSSEKLLLPAVANLHSQVESKELKLLLSGYERKIEKQLIRLDEIFGLLLLPTGERETDSMSGLLLELKKLVATTKNKVAREAAILQSVQKAIHLKIVGYANLEMLAIALGMEEISNLLHLSAEDERDQEGLFTEFAVRKIERLFEFAKH